jgi:hypothetical protein
VASDCMEVIQGLQHKNLGVFSLIPTEIKSRAGSRNGVSFHYESRNSNHEADQLARFAMSVDAGRHVWMNNPCP